jgi:hypothetical protein
VFLDDDCCMKHSFERSCHRCGALANRSAAGTLAGGEHAVARGATLRRDLVTVPARFAAPARKPTLHLPAHWPWQIGWKPCGTTSSATVRRSHEQDDRHVPRLPAIPGPTPETRGKLVQASGSLMPAPFRTAPNDAEISPATARRH